MLMSCRFCFPSRLICCCIELLALKYHLNDIRSLIQQQQRGSYKSYSLLFSLHCNGNESRPLSVESEGAEMVYLVRLLLNSLKPSLIQWGGSLFVPLTFHNHRQETSTSLTLWCSSFTLCLPWTKWRITRRHMHNDVFGSLRSTSRLTTMLCGE